MKAANIRDVAKEAGVSVATVSRAMNNAKSVSPELKKRVQAAARKLGYRPNTVARSLRRRHTRIWALIISDITTPFFTSVARGVEDVAQKAGYSVMLCNADEDPVKEAHYLEVAEQDQVAGVILSPHSAGTDVSLLHNSSIPCVVIDRPLSESIDSVVVDSRAGAREATLHLLDSGWRRPACITGPEDAYTAVERRRGYEDALRERGLSYTGKIIHQPFRADGGRRAAAELLSSETPPDSFFVANTALALGVLAEFAERGLRAGTDIGIITFDEVPWASLLTSPLSVVSQPAYEVGAEAARLLAHRMLEEAAPVARKVILATTLIARESSQRIQDGSRVVPASVPDKYGMS